MLNKAGNTTWTPAGTSDNINGESWTKAQINTDGTLGGRFTAPTWITANGKLPGFNAAINMPEHLQMITFSGGDGSPTDPYIITTAQQLRALAIVVNEGDTDYYDKAYKLGNEIDLSDYGATFNDGKGWMPIGYGIGKHFLGNFNGNGYKISNLYINNNNNITGNFMGLFGYLLNASIENLGVENVDIIGNNNIGGIAGKFYESNIYNSYATGVVRGNDYVGGIVGGEEEDCTISNCYSTVNVSGNDYVGGIIGITNYNCITSNCYSTGIVNGNDYVGGIAGFVLESEISNCAALNPKVACNANVGRVAGTLYTGTEISSNNIAFDGMLNKAGNTDWDNIGLDDLDGESISKEYIYANPTLERFESPVWTSKKGRLPGLFGKTVEMPEHLRLEGSPTITTTTLPNGETTKDYSVTLTATGNTPITWRILTGNLPTGLTLNASTGVISGTPTTKGSFTFTIEIENNLGFDEKEFTIEVTDGVGVEELKVENGQLKIYPNPVSYELQVTSYEGMENGELTMENVKIFNLMGQTLMSLPSLPSPETTIDVSHLPASVYILKIGNKTAKFVKQ